MKLIIKSIIVVLVFITVCGIYPRELQFIAPTIFAMVQVVVFAFTIRILKDL